MSLRLVPGSGPSIEITRDRVVVGRDPTCEVVVNDPSISRRHARLERRGEGWTVVDEGSSNGTFVNSQRVSTAQVTHGQELRFGTAGFRVEITVAARDAAPPSATIFEAAPTPAVRGRPQPPAAGQPKPARRPPAATPPQRQGEDTARAARTSPSRGLPRWMAGAAVVVLVAAATAAALLLTGGRNPEGTAPASSGAQAAAAPLPVGSLRVRTLSTERTADGPKVTLRMEISGFATRPEGDGYRIDLVVDLATFGPDGEPIPDLTHVEFRRLSQVLGAQERAASLTTTLAPPAGSRPGPHRARFTVRDLVAGTQAVHEVPFEDR